jgi:LDH2 family malate/lactate/ureidoglycolate dehydrogenase
MLEPAAGAKGFGLALMIDLLAGLLSGGSVGGEVASMYGDPAAPADCSWLFVAIDPRHFGVAGVLSERAAEVAARIRKSRRQLGVSAIGPPGDRKLRAEAEAAGMVSLPAALVEELDLLADELGVARLEAGHGD